MLVAEHWAINSFLGDAENPAHTDWKERTENFKGKYENATKILRLIKGSILKIVTMIDEPKTERLQDFLKHVFSVPKEDLEDEGDKTEEPDVEPPTRKKHDYKINYIDGGFRVQLNNNKTKLSKIAILRIAYDVRSGSPFSQHDHSDFNLKDGIIKISYAGCKAIDIKANEMKLEINNKDFELKLLDFDKRRDLIVSIK